MALAMNPVFKGRDFISIHDFNSDEIAYILQFALQLKKMQQEGKPHPVLAGKDPGHVIPEAVHSCTGYRSRWA